MSGSGLLVLKSKAAFSSDPATANAVKRLVCH